MFTNYTYKVTATTLTTPIERTKPAVRCEYCTRQYHHDSAPDTCTGCGASLARAGEKQDRAADVAKYTALILSNEVMFNAYKKNAAQPTGIITLPDEPKRHELPDWAMWLFFVFFWGVVGGTAYLTLVH